MRGVRWISLLAVLAVCCCIPSAQGAETRLVLQVAPGREECFYEDVKDPDSTVFLQYLVTLGGSQDIDVTVKNPSGNLIWTTTSSSENRVAFLARATGSYLFCFSNEMSVVSSKVISFMVSVQDNPAKKRVRKSGVEKVRKSVDQIINTFQQIEQLQDYIRVRERMYRTVVEKANTRVFLWAGVEVAVMVGMSYVNVVMLRRMFATKRFV